MISIHSQINALSRSRWTSNHLHVLRSPPSSGVSTVVVCHKKDIRANTSTGIQHVEVDYLEAEASATEPEPPKPFMSAVQTHETENRTYMVLLAVITQIWESEEKLDAFLSSRPESSALPFLLWLSEREASATGSDKQMLSALCEYLVLRRERLDDERMEALYASTLELLVGESVPQSSEPPSLEGSGIGSMVPEESLQLQLRREEALSLLSSNPDLYALELAERLTGAPVIVDGYPNPIFDLIVKTEAPAAVTPEGIRRAHAAAAELATELKGRRKRSVASIIGRAKLTAEQADQLKAGTAASRILDMLLALPTQEARINSLADCFTPPAANANTDDASSSNAESTNEELWCTAAQMLSEIEVRIRNISSKEENLMERQKLLSPGEGSLPSGPDLAIILDNLRLNIKQTWLEGLGGKSNTGV